MITASVTISRTGLGLKDLTKTLTRIQSKAAKVGILQSTADRDNSNLAQGSTGLRNNNADVGFANEFGSVTGWRAISRDAGYLPGLGLGRDEIHGDSIPERSFLRGPLATHLMDRAGLIGKGVLSSVSGQDFPEGAVEILGVAGVQTVHEAFDTRGFGLWPSNSPEVVAFKGRDDPLHATGQLHNSIAFETVAA